MAFKHRAARLISASLWRMNSSVTSIKEGYLLINMLFKAVFSRYDSIRELL